MRHAHYVRKNQTSETVNRAIFAALQINARRAKDGATQYSFDRGEAILSYRNPVTGRYIDTYAAFESVSSFWKLVNDHVRDRTRTNIIVERPQITCALLEMFTTSVKHGWILSLAVIECPPLILRFRREAQTLLVWAMENVWPSPSLATSTDESAWQQCGPQTSEPYKRDEPLARRRVREMARQCQQWWIFLRSNDMGCFKPTAASQAFQTFRHKHMQHEIFIDTNTDALALARRGYYGGRSECFYVGRANGSFHLLDVNSMYASVMLNLDVPIRLAGYYKHVTVDTLTQFTADFSVLADVELSTQLPSIPVRDGIRLLFPVGRFRTVLAGHELQRACQDGIVQAVHACTVYHTGQAFTRFVADNWDARQLAKAAGDTVAADGYKLMLASFYGKWGQSGGVWEMAGEAEDMQIRRWTEVNYHTQEAVEWRQFAGQTQRRSKETETYESHPAIAACITAAARIKLWDLIQTAGRDNVYYVDTDSLLVNDDGLQRLSHEMVSTQLGGLRLEGSYSSIAIRSCKNYVLDNNARRAGARRSAVVNDSDVVVQDNVRSLTAAVSDGDLQRASARRVRKTFDHVYDKGIIGIDGRVSPIRRFND